MAPPIDPSRRDRYGEGVVRTRLRLTALGVALLMTLAGCATPGPTPAERLGVLYPEDQPFAESRFSTVQDLRLHFRAWSPAGEARAKLLLLHTAGASTVSFRLLGPKLAEDGVAVLAVDLPGFGYSDTALGFDHSVGGRAALLWALLDRLDAEENEFAPALSWTVGGHGMGGQVAVQLAVDRPERTGGLLLFASPVDRSVDVLRGSWFPPVRWGLRAWIENSLYTPEGVQELLSEAHGRPATQEEVDLYTAPLLRDEMAQAFVNYAHSAGTVTLELERQVRSTLVIWGDADPMVERSRADAIVSRLPDASLVTVAGAAHLPMETHVTEVVPAVLSWIHSLP